MDQGLVQMSFVKKPLVLNPWNVDALIEIENEYANKANTILQLRYHEAIIDLKNKIDNADPRKAYIVLIWTYITSRGSWYYTSWKGDESKSGVDRHQYWDSFFRYANVGFWSCAGFFCSYQDS